MAAMHKKRNPAPQIAIASLASELDAAPARAFRILPAGQFAPSDGRPMTTQGGIWQLFDEDGARIASEFNARASARVIDYEHATVLAKTSGNKAPAAGWIKRLEWRPGDGLWAVDVEWTEAAAQAIAAREYRYVSPVFTYDPNTGRVISLLHAALTNDPALDGLTDLAALAAQLFSSPNLPPINPTQEDASMDHLHALLAALGLPASATQEESLAALTALKTNVATLTAQIASPDPAKFVPVATLTALQTEHKGLQDKYDALSAQVNDDKVEQAIASGKAAGKISPALESWARDLGKKDIAALNAWLDKTPAIVPLNGTQTGGQGEGGNVAALSAEQSKVCALMGIDEAEYRKTLAAK
jgi:hypothetical protein